METPKPTKLYKIEQRNSIPSDRLVSTYNGGKGYPYALAKSLKRQCELTNNPRGTYFKLVPWT
jgi:hypothetical protein